MLYNVERKYVENMYIDVIDNKYVEYMLYDVYVTLWQNAYAIFNNI